MARYARDVELGRTVGRTVGLKPVFAWQPLLVSAPERAGDPGAIVPEDRAIWDKVIPVARREMPRGVVNLADSLDGVDRPVFKDVWHTNEYGAEVVATALWARLYPMPAVAAARTAPPRTQSSPTT